MEHVTLDLEDDQNGLTEFSGILPTLKNQIHPLQSFQPRNQLHISQAASQASQAAAGLPPFKEQILSRDSSLLLISSLRLLPDTCSQWLASAGLL